MGWACCLEFVIVQPADFTVWPSQGRIGHCGSTESELDPPQEEGGGVPSSGPPSALHSALTHWRPPAQP